MTETDVDHVLASLIDTLAAIEHERWSHWQKYLHSKCVANPDGTLTVPQSFAEKWAKQASTSYSDLSADEQKSDREQVQRYLPVIATAIKSAV